MEEFQQHPATGQQLVGTRLPHWQEVRRVNDACARLFAPVRYQSLDIALTDAGPVVVEVNVGGSFVLPQMASGQGLLTRSEEHTSELPSLMRTSYAVLCLKKTNR